MSIARSRRRPDAEAAIVETPGVCGGYPCVGNTRIAVSIIVEAYRQVGESLERTAQVFPQLTIEQVRAALAYYEGHCERVDADIARNVQAMKELEREQWPGSA